MLEDLYQKPPITAYLQEHNILDSDEINHALENTNDQKLTDFEIISKEFGNRPVVNQALAAYAGVNLIPLLELPKVPSQVLNEIPRDVVSNSHIFPFAYGENEQELKVSFADPTQFDLIETLTLRTNKKIIPFYSSWSEIDALVARYYGSAEVLEAARLFEENNMNDIEETKLSDLSGDSPVVTLVNSTLTQAAKMRASDIHIEPMEDRLRIRFRVDGALVEMPTSFPISMHSAIIARLKIMGNMDIAEKRQPQDGRITFMVGTIEYDIRVSTLPTVYGEKCVMRLAMRSNLQRDKKDLGLTDYDMKIFDKVFSNPNGIILVTGPTGSGKSTTLYTALSELNTEDVNIITVEDPVEANVAGINQVQTNVRAGLTFASALRSILRQDPDIIMIGEIRDQETAEIAVQAAITGHLVVSTLHTNSASATVTRLINMGLPAYMVADSVVGILAQRLVRRLCPKCKRQRMATALEMKELGLREGIKPIPIYDKVGCAYCNNTGFNGRTAVYEIMSIEPELKEMIVQNATTADIKRTALKSGMHTLHRSAAELVIKGITTIDEMKKVSSEE